MENISLTCHVKNELLRRAKEERSVLKIILKKGSNLGQILPRNCLLKHVIEWRIDGMVKRERRRKQLLDDLKETRGCWKMKEETLGRFVENSLWKTLWTCLRTDSGVNDRHNSPPLRFQRQCGCTDLYSSSARWDRNIFLGLFLHSDATVQIGPRPLLLRFVDHTQLDTHAHTVCRIPLNEWSARLLRPLPAQHTTNTRVDHPHLRQDSKPWSHQASGGRDRP